MNTQGNIITADEGKVLTNGDTYSRKVWLGINDSPANWYEIDEEEYDTITQNEDNNL